MDKKHIDENEDVDKYGEFVCSYFAWLQPSSQKEKAKELSNMTKKKEDKSHEKAKKPLPEAGPPHRGRRV